MEILKIEPNWWHGYANQPSIKVTVDTRIPHEEFVYDRDPPGATNKVMLVSTNCDPWVRFVYIDNPNGDPRLHGALGGNYKLTDGTVLNSRSGWSSREGVVNSQYLHLLMNREVVDVSLKAEDESPYMGWAGYYIFADYLKKHPAWPKDLYLVRHSPKWAEDEIYHTISVDPDKVVKALAY